MNLKNTIFFNVDTQKDFLDPDGALYVKDSEFIKPQLQLLTQIAEEKHIKVINTADYHTDKSVEISKTPDFINTFPSHCLNVTEGCDFIDETNPKTFGGNYYIVNYTDDEIDTEKFHRARNIIILKDEFDVFKGNKLTGKVLELLNATSVTMIRDIIENVVVYGIVSSICVKFAVDGLLSLRRFKVFVVIDAIKDLPGYATDALYTYWINKGVILTTTEKINKGE